jgi:hypothetical protein
MKFCQGALRPLKQGPAYGLHLVRVTEVWKGPFTEVRVQVLEEWRREQERGASEQYVAGLLKKYDLAVDKRLQLLSSNRWFGKEDWR